ncbi:hypothetical protein [Mycobacterium servetii]|uniref:Metalloprotease n=1 Tax=Mycobacterium servetii TaxID=3237418 RepID=A0ABV4BY36_9MYCO
MGIVIRYGTTTLAALGMALSISACSQTVEGHPTASHTETVPVVEAGTPTPTPASVPAPPTGDVPQPRRELTVAELVPAIVANATAYWSEHGEKFPLPGVVADVNANPCPWHDDMAAMCDGVVYYDSTAVEGLRRDSGDLAVAEVFGHEVGHAVEHYAGRDQVDHTTLEARADCASGAFIAARFTQVTEDRATEVFNQTEMFGTDGIPTRAFRAGFEAARNNADVVDVCTTYTTRGR